MIHNTKCTMKEVLLSIKEKYLQEGERAVEEDKRCHRGRIAESAELLFRCRYFYQVMNRQKA